jgi:hypothetical protein
VRHVIEEGVYRVDPATYQMSTTSNGEVRIVDRITDLPIENSRILAQYEAENESQDEPNISNIEQFLNAQFETLRTKMSSSSLSQSFDGYPNNAEYDTLTTSVSHSVAQRIIAEAQASGATI